MDVKSVAGEGSGENEEQAIESVKKKAPCYILTENLAELYPKLLWKTEFVRNELEYLA